MQFRHGFNLTLAWTLSIIKPVAAVMTSTKLARTAFVCDGVSDDRTISLYTHSSGLDSYVGANVLQELLYDTGCNFDGKCFSKYLGEFIAVALTAGIGLFVALLVMVAFVFFSPCLCSRRWRQWKGWKRIKEYDFAHNFNPRLLRLLIGLFGLMFLAAVVNMVVVLVQKNDMRLGMNNALCQTHRFLNETLNGGNTTVFFSDVYTVTASFPGLTSATAILKNVTDLIAPSSPLVTKLNNWMTLSGYVDQEFVALQSVFQSLNTVMKANYWSAYNSLLFAQNFTYFVKDIYPNHPIHPSMLAVNNSLAGVLHTLRSQLQPLVINDVSLLYKTLNSTSSAVSSFVNQLVKVIDNWVLANVSLIYTTFDYFDFSIIATVAFACIPIALGIFTVIKGLMLSTRDDDYSDPTIPPVSPRVASIPMCITLFYTIFAFIISAIILTTATALASSCLVMEDAGSVAARMSFRFGSSDISSRVGSIVQQCLQSGTDGDILSAITVDGESTARDKVNTLTLLNGQFTVIKEAIDNGQTNNALSGNMHFQNLGTYLASVGDFYTVRPWDQMKMLNDTTGGYCPTTDSLIFNTNYTLGLEVFQDIAASVPECPDRVVLVDSTPPGVLAQLINHTYSATPTPRYTVPGISSSISLLTQNGVSTGISTCPSTAWATQNLVPWGNLMTDKLIILNNDKFRCDFPIVVADATASTFATGAVKLTCTLANLHTYMQNYTNIISERATALDLAVDTNYDAIFNQLWAVINDELLSPVQWLGSTLNCQFISVRWNALFQALCVVFAPSMITLGKSLLGLGFIGLFVLIIQIIVWRHLKDNMCLWQDNVRRNPVPVDDTGLLRRVSTFTVVEVNPSWTTAKSGALSDRADNKPGGYLTKRISAIFASVFKERDSKARGSIFKFFAYGGKNDSSRRGPN